MSDFGKVGNWVLECLDFQQIWNRGYRVPECARMEGFFWSAPEIGDRSILDQALASGLWMIDGARGRVISVTRDANDPESVRFDVTLGVIPQLRAVPDPNVPGAIRLQQARTWAQQHGLNFVTQPPFGTMHDPGLKGWTLAPESRIFLTLRATR